MLEVEASSKFIQRYAYDISRDDIIIVEFRCKPIKLNVSSTCYNSGCNECLVTTEMDKSDYFSFFDYSDDINILYKSLRESYPIYHTDFIDICFICYEKYTFNILNVKR